MYERPTESALVRRLSRAVAGQTVDFSTDQDKRLLELARRNGVAPLLAFRIAQGSVAGIDRETADALKDTAKGHAARDLALTHHTRQALSLLAGAGLRCLLMKGMPLSLMHYSKPYLRERSDTDIYISRDDIDETVSALRTADYDIHGLGARRLASKQFQARTRSTAGLSATFDIHYSISNRVLFRDSLLFDECWEARQKVLALGPNAWALSDIDLLLHACIHRLAHGRGSERDHLLWLYDIHLLWNALDGDGKGAFVEKALAKKVGVVCADALSVCDELFGTIATRVALTKGSEPCKSELARDQDHTPSKSPGHWLTTLRQNLHYEPTARLIDAGKLRWAWADVMAVPGLANKIAFAKELILKN